jgi:hypothetical protein
MVKRGQVYFQFPLPNEAVSLEKWTLPILVPLML